MPASLANFTSIRDNEAPVSHSAFATRLPASAWTPAQKGFARLIVTSHSLLCDLEGLREMDLDRLLLKLLDLERE